MHTYFQKTWLVKRLVAKEASFPLDTQDLLPILRRKTEEAKMSSRVHNFNAGPGSHPMPVLEGIQAEFLDFKGSGMSVVEVSHRSTVFEEVIEDGAPIPRAGTFWSFDWERMTFGYWEEGTWTPGLAVVDHDDGTIRRFVDQVIAKCNVAAEYAE